MNLTAYQDMGTTAGGALDRNLIKITRTEHASERDLGEWRTSQEAAAIWESLKAKCAAVAAGYGELSLESDDKGTTFTLTMYALIDHLRLLESIQSLEAAAHERGKADGRAAAEAEVTMTTAPGPDTARAADTSAHEAERALSTLSDLLDPLPKPVYRAGRCIGLVSRGYGGWVAHRWPGEIADWSDPRRFDTRQAAVAWAEGAEDGHSESILTELSAASESEEVALARLKARTRRDARAKRDALTRRTIAALAELTQTRAVADESGGE